MGRITVIVANDLQGLPNPNEPFIHISILSLNSSYGSSPKDHGNVMLKSQVEDFGNISMSINWIDGVVINPVVGSLSAPLKKWSTSASDTSSLSA